MPGALPLSYPCLEPSHGVEPRVAGLEVRCSDVELRRQDGGAATIGRGADDRRLPRSPQLHELLDERQHARDLSDRRAPRDRLGVDAEGCGLARMRAGVLDDQCVREVLETESLGEATEGRLVGHRERDDDRRRVTGGFARRVSCLSDLRTVREVSPDQRVENLGRRSCVGRSRRAEAFTLDASATRVRCDVRVVKRLASIRIVPPRPISGTPRLDDLGWCEFLTQRAAWPMSSASPTVTTATVNAASAVIAVAAVLLDRMERPGPRDLRVAEEEELERRGPRDLLDHRARPVRRVQRAPHR